MSHMRNVVVVGGLFFGACTVEAASTPAPPGPDPVADAGGGDAATLVAPSSLAYAKNPAVYTRGYAITPNTPTSAGGAVTSYAIDAATGAPTSTGTTTATGAGPAYLAIHPSGRFAYVANYTSSTVSAFAIDAVTGKLTSAADAVDTGATPHWITIDPAGKFA